MLLLVKLSYRDVKKLELGYSVKQMREQYCVGFFQIPFDGIVDSIK